MAGTTLRAQSDAIEGERVICTYKGSNLKPQLIRRTDQHRGNMIILKKAVRCVIDKEIKGIK